MNKPATPLSASLDVLPNAIVAASILPFVASTDWLNFRAASRRCYEIVHGHDVFVTAEHQHEEEESKALWSLALVRDYRFELPPADDESGGRRSLMYQTIRCNPDPNDGVNSFLSTSDVFTASTAFMSWKHWRKIDVRLHSDESGRQFDVAPSAQLVGPYFLRAASLWRKIEQWCSDERLSGNIGPIIHSTLQPGAPFGRSLVEGFTEGYRNGKLSAFKAIYSFFSGQRWDNRFIERTGVLPGLLGGFTVYDQFSNITLEKPLQIGPKLVVARDINGKKIIDFDVESGEVHVHARSVKRGVSFDSDDQILRWFENYADQLQNYSVGFLNPDDTTYYKAILRFPNVGDTFNCSRAVTRGIEVVASSTFVFELGDIYVYSIRIRLLRPEDGEGYMSPEERGFDTCQLVSRHWIITQGGEVNEVRGEGVVGYYPLLREGGCQRFISHDGGRTFYEEDVIGEDDSGGYFSYQSCTGGEEGTMEGYLQFKAGSIQAGNGEVFDVRVAPFPLRRPQDYHY